MTSQYVRTTFCEHRGKLYTVLFRAIYPFIFELPAKQIKTARMSLVVRVGQIFGQVTVRVLRLLTERTVRTVHRKLRSVTVRVYWTWVPLSPVNTILHNH